MTNIRLRLFSTALAFLLAFAAFLVVTPAQAAGGKDEPAKQAQSTFKMRQQAMMAKAGSDQGIVTSPQAVPDAVQVCAPRKCIKCIWWEKTNYCDANTACGQDIGTPCCGVPNPAYCPSGYRCWNSGNKR